MKKLSIIIILLIALCQSGLTQINQDLLPGTWKLKSYDVIEKIKYSAMYANGSEEEKKRFDDMVKLIKDSTRYNFKPDKKLVYTDIDQMKLKIIRRNARWSIKGKTLLIKETDRAFKREASIVALSKNKLVIIPIINGVVGTSKMVFIR